MPLTFMRALRDSRLESGARNVGNALALRANGEGRCYPSVPKIATDAGLRDVRAVRRAIAALVDEGLVHVERRAGLHAVNVYVLHTPVGAPDVPTSDVPSTLDVATRAVGTSAALSALDASPVGTSNALRVGTSNAPQTAQGTAHRTAQDPLRLSPPSTKPTKKRKPAKEASPDHAKVIAHWHATHEAAKGEKPTVKASDGNAAKQLLAAMPLDKVLAVITRAYENPWLVEHKPSLTYIWSNVDAYRGTSTATPKANGRALQPAGAGWAPARPLTDAEES